MNTDKIFDRKLVAVQEAYDRLKDTDHPNMKKVLDTAGDSD